MSQKGRLLFGIAIVLFLSFGGLYFAIQAWMPFMWFVLLPALFSLLGWIYLDRSILYDFLTMKTTKYGMNMGAMLLIVLLFLVSFNLLVVKKNKSFDFSTEKIFTLSPLSISVLQKLDAPIEIKFFYRDSSENVEQTKKSFNQMAKLYQENSANVRVEFVEMNSNPKLTLDYGANKPAGEAFVSYKGQKNRIESQFAGQMGQKYHEQDFTNAIVKVTRAKKKTVYFLEGHQEREIENEKSEQGAFLFKQLLEKNSYLVKKLNFVQTPQLPEDADVIVILAPVSRMLKTEVDLIRKYLVQGGSLFLALDDKNTAGLDTLLNEFGVSLEQHYVFNILNSPMGQVVNSNQPTVAVDYASTSPITKVFNTNQTAIFVKPNSLLFKTESNHINKQVIVKTPEASVALLNLTSEDYEGKPRAFNLMAEVTGQLEKDAKIFKVVVAADADFVSNMAILQNVNRDLALNSIANLVNETDLISITPKEAGVSKMLMSPPEFSQYFKFVVMGLILPFPFLFLIISIALWFKRRHA